LSSIGAINGTGQQLYTYNNSLSKEDFFAAVDLSAQTTGSPRTGE